MIGLVDRKQRARYRGKGSCPTWWRQTKISILEKLGINKFRGENEGKFKVCFTNKYVSIQIIGKHKDFESSTLEIQVQIYELE